MLSDTSRDKNCEQELEQCVFSHLLFAFLQPEDDNI